MIKPQPRFQPYRIQKAINRQSWLVLALVFIGIGLDMVLAKTSFAISKNLLAGALLAWIGQLVFAKIALGVTGSKHKHKIVHRMYQATLAKWLITFIGFAGVFGGLKPLLAVWVFVGFIVLQISHILVSFRLQS
ncbi:ATP synthase subunit I [Moraxella macacae 0408225]|uniref:ATP synthase subunit I n=1 Tax=Moraxella macacae 0408225 TaxID=1230338 RepID=L2F9F6_9GAMM|nr:ATP synthase subunit I [Moraxella macacae]ELA09540.1 ATP synthase subunit I [Moraxella macacae 0408225]